MKGDAVVSRIKLLEPWIYQGVYKRGDLVISLTVLRILVVEREE
jgi:hypothetical protein